MFSYKTKELIPDFTNRLIAFVKTKNPKEEYHSLNLTECALGQFVATYGYVGQSTFFMDKTKQYVQYYNTTLYHTVLGYSPVDPDTYKVSTHTFGDLAKRLELVY